MGEFSAHRRGAAEELGRLRVAAPCRVANASRNAGAEFGRRRRWRPARDALWQFLEPVLGDGARVAIVGAGNGDDLPLRRIARRAGTVTLIDIDPRAACRARQRLGRAERAKVTAIGHDVTEGAADRIVLAARGGPDARSSAVSGTVACGDGGDSPPATRYAAKSDPAGIDGRSAIAAVDPPHFAADPGEDPGEEGGPLPGAPYDLIVGDLFYSQLLYPALVDLDVAPDRRAETLRRHARPLTRAVVARLHASASRVVHVHDPIAWWSDHEQPVTLEEILVANSADGPEAALSLVARGNGPRESDPRTALTDLGLAPSSPLPTALWRWPFAPGVDYLACATLAVPGWAA